MMSDSTTSTDQTSGLLDRPQQAPLRFAFVGGPRDGQVIRINASKCSIGSSEQASFRLVCKGVHPVHCTILRGLGGTVVKCISADTLINGETFEEAMLNDGDVLTIGPLRFRVLAEQGAVSPAPAVSPQPVASQQPATPAAAKQTSVAELQQRIQQLEAERELERLQLEAQQREAALAEAEAQSQAEPEPTEDATPFQQSDLADQATTNDVTHSRNSALDMLNKLRDEPAESASDSFDATDEQSSSPESFDSETSSNDYSAPQSEEELTFSEPDDAPPIDTAAILAKFGHTLEDDSDGTKTAFLGDTPAPASNFAESTPSFEPANSYGGEAATSTAEGEDESIDDYMAQLMARVGGETEQAPKTSQPAPPKPKPTPAAPSKPARAERRVPLDPSEFVPRAVAPEASSNLRALRAVANTSARSAIDRHQRRSFDNKAYICWFIAIVAAIVCFSMAFFAKEIVSLPTLVSMLALMISFFATINGLAFAAKAKVGLRATQQQLLANLDASDSPKRP